MELLDKLLSFYDGFWYNNKVEKKMGYLEINNLIIDDISLSMNINGDYVGFIGKEEVIKKFFTYFAGINKSDAVKTNREDVFDNSLFFQNRVVMDFSKRYITTLKGESIKEAFKNKFEIDVDMERFTKHIAEFSLRKEAIFDVKYTFTDFGNTLLNYSLMDSFEVGNMFIINPLYKIEDKELKHKIIKGIVNKKYKNLLIDASDLLSFDMLDYYVFLNSKEAVIVSKDTEVLIYPKDSQVVNPIYEANNYVICLKGIKDRYSLFHKVHYKKMKMKDAICYLSGDKHEKE